MQCYDDEKHWKLMINGTNIYRSKSKNYLCIWQTNELFQTLLLNTRTSSHCYAALPRDKTQSQCAVCVL